MVIYEWAHTTMWCVNSCSDLNYPRESIQVRWVSNLPKQWCVSSEITWRPRLTVEALSWGWHRISLCSTLAGLHLLKFGSMHSIFVSRFKIIWDIYLDNACEVTKDFFGSLWAPKSQFGNHKPRQSLRALSGPTCKPWLGTGIADNWFCFILPSPHPGCFQE